MAFKTKSCDHLDQLNTALFDPKDHCEQCRIEGSTWLHLRICQTCGKTLCCDDSPKKHASAHFAQSDHPVIASAEEGERWFWCYTHRLFKRY